MDQISFLLYVMLGLPLGSFFLTGILWLMGVEAKEKWLGRNTKLISGLMLLACCWLTMLVLQRPDHLHEVVIGDWFRVGSYQYPLAFRLDPLSLAYVTLTILLCGIVGSFSITYLHRDPGFLRFFQLLYLFTFGALLVFTASSLDLLIAGWEMVGITSVMLISFFQYRPEPVRNALRVFATYRVADLFILTAVFLAHHWFGSADWSRLLDACQPGHGSTVSSMALTVFATLLVFAASGKSAQGPFCSWLPRAMEGPTPSSAIFYGAIAVHAGPYLLLRVEPLIRQSALATGLLAFIGGTTAVVATMMQRSSTDAKTSLAYASQTQLGIIFVEIALGWQSLAMIHVIGHATVRAMQFLRSPSMLSDHHRLHSGAGGRLEATGAHYDVLIPERVQWALYCFTLFRGYHEILIERFVIRPVLAASRLLRIFDSLPGTSPDRRNRSTMLEAPPARTRS